MNFELGKCYKVEFSDGSIVEFKMLNQNDRGLMQVETPIGTGKIDVFEVLTAKGYKSIEEIPCP